MRRLALVVSLGCAGLAHAGGAGPTATGTSSPAAVSADQFVQLIAEVTPASDPPSTGLAVGCDLAAIDRFDWHALSDDGGHGDGAPGDLRFGFLAYVLEGTAPGEVALPCTVSDAEGRTGFFTIAVTVVAACGDGTVGAGEVCDDGGVEDGDGCSAACAREDGWVCAQTPSVCVERCGDGLIVGVEGCDDAGRRDGDGCDRGCQVEPSWACSGEPSRCVPSGACGNGVVEPGEACDDGGAIGDDRDGCDATCVIDEGWQCAGEPSICCDLPPDQACPVPVDAGVDDDASDPGAEAGDAGCGCRGGGDAGGLLALLLLALAGRRRLSGSR